MRIVFGLVDLPYESFFYQEIITKLIWDHLSGRRRGAAAAALPRADFVSKWHDFRAAAPRHDSEQLVNANPFENHGSLNTKASKSSFGAHLLTTQKYHTFKFNILGTLSKCHDFRAARLAAKDRGNAK